MAVAVYGAIASRSFNDGWRYDDDYPTLGNPRHLNVWQSDAGLGQGTYSTSYFDPRSGSTYDAQDGPFYGTFDFGNGSGRPTELSGKIIDSVQLRLTRDTDSPGSTSGVTTTVYATNLTSIPGAGTHSPEGQTTGAGTTSPGFTKGQTRFFDLPIALAQAVIAGKCLCLYTGSGRLASFVGADGTTELKPRIDIYYHDPAPVLTKPSLATPATVNDSPHTFTCGASSDSSGLISAGSLDYVFSISFDNGATWSSESLGYSAAGTPSKSLDIKGASFLNIAATRYYYNTAVKVRVRVHGVYAGEGYFSSYAISNAFTVDYRIAPSAPSLTPSKPNPYETETITFILGLPAARNAYDAEGAVNVLTYRVELTEIPPNPPLLASDSAPVTSDPPELSYTVGEHTIDMDDRVTAIKAICTDAEEQVGSYSDTVPFTIRRFRRPRATATISARLANTCTVNVVVIDTGHGGLQDPGQIQKIQYKGVPGATNWTDASLKGSWAGDPGAFTNSFDLASLEAGMHYDLLVRAVSKPPYGTGTYPAGRDGWEYERTILEYLPGLGQFKRPAATGDEAKAGGYMQAGIVGDNPNTPVNKGDFSVQGALFADVDKEVFHGGNSSGLISLLGLLTTANCIRGGSDDNGYWKFDNGLLINFRRTSGSVAITTAFGSLYRSTTLWADAFALPFLAGTVPIQIDRLYHATIPIIKGDSISPTNTNWGAVLVVYSASTASTTVGLMQIAIGRWK